MLIVGVLSNIKLVAAKFDLDRYRGSLTDSDHLFQQFAVLFFSSYLLMDSWLGSKYYHKYMSTLSGYFHHASYLLINLLALWSGDYPLYLLFMLEELPTVLLSLGSFDHRCRSDKTFGITFFLTRILFHLYMIYKLQQNNSKLCYYFALTVLPLHVYWFYGWCKKYGIQAFNKRKKHPKVHQYVN
jgi:hypothetical protein